MQLQFSLNLQSAFWCTMTERHSLTRGRRLAGLRFRPGLSASKRGPPSTPMRVHGPSTASSSVNSPDGGPLDFWNGAWRGQIAR